MNEPSKSNSRIPIFVDEVDHWFEFEDECIDNMNEWVASSSPAREDPEKVKKVDRVQDEPNND